jgi:hypothetical protein
MKFTVQQMGGKAGGKLFVRLSSYLFPAVGQLGEALGKMDFSKGLSSDLDVGSVARGISAASGVLFDKLTEQEYEELLAKLLETAYVEVNGKTVQLWPLWDDVMAGKVLTQLKLLAFALEVNYSDFLPALGVLNRVAAGASDSEVSSTSMPSGSPGV